MVKIGKTYYLFYSANDFRNPDYAVGYATATSPLGPWKKHGKPIITRRQIGENGTGHGDLFKDANGNWMYVFHTHNNRNQVGPRRTAVVQLNFDGTDFSVVEGSFRFLTLP